MADRQDTTRTAILQWVLDRLRTQLKLSDSQCYLTADAMAPPVIPPGDFFLTVSPGAGQFVLGEAAVGNLTEHWTFRIRLFVRILRDRSGQDQQRLLDAQRGLFAWQQKVLAALTGADNPDWNLRGWIAPVTASEVQWVQGGRNAELNYLTMTIDFQADFDWDIELQ